MNKKKLYFVTESYIANRVFFETEMERLLEEYDVTFIGCTGQEETAGFEKRAKVYFYKNTVSKWKKIIYAAQYIFNKTCHEEYVRNVKTAGLFSKTYWTRLVKSIEYYASAQEFYKFFRKIAGDDKDFIYYTYWCNYYALAMNLHRHEYPGIKVISRIHRFDLYDLEFPGGIQPFKYFINRNLDKLLFISSNSMEEYKIMHPELLDEKIMLNRLGTKTLEIKSAGDDEKSFHMASCSRVVPVKRVELIVEALAKLDMDVKWVHFGGGESFDAVSKLAHEKLDAKSNISYELKGPTDNEDIRRYYSENRIDAFINVSSSEGAPVSIMEAMSVKTPIIATNVGEASLMVDGNGVLLSENPEAGEIAAAITSIATCSDAERKAMKEKSYKIWTDMFSLEVNVNAFLQYLKEIEN